MVGAPGAFPFSPTAAERARARARPLSGTVLFLLASYEIIILITFNLHTACERLPWGAGRGRSRPASLRPLYFSVMFSPFSTKFLTNHIISGIIMVITKKRPQSSYLCNRSIDAQILDNYE